MATSEREPMSTRRIVVLMALLAAVAMAGAWIAVRTLVSDRFAAATMPGGPFALVDSTGETVTDRTYRGKWELVFFGYTFCPDLCPTTLAAMAEALDRLGPLASRVQPIFISLDPKRDTPAVVGDYVAGIDKRIVGLTGSTEAVAAAATQFRVQYATVKTGDGADDYLLDHTGFIYLMNPEGIFVRVLAGNVTGSEMAEKLRPLIAPAT
jgi:protein SCO1/2